MSSTPGFRTPERRIPAPASVSVEARAVLSREPAGLRIDWPDPGDHRGWLDEIDRLDHQANAAIEAAGIDLGDADAQLGCAIETIVVGGVPVYIATPPGLPAGDDRAHLYIHGGAWILGRGANARFMAALTALTLGVTVWSVDYRMPPAHPFPVPVDDCFAAYGELLRRHSADRVAIGGVSAGGNLAAALVVRLTTVGMPLPRAVVLDTPATDLTESGDTWFTNLGVDPTLLTQVGPAIALYADGHDLTDPLLSPLFADHRGWPPTLLLSGTRDLILSDTVRLHQALLSAGVPAELQVFEAQGHSGFGGAAPEDQARSAAQRAFVARHLPSPASRPGSLA